MNEINQEDRVGPEVVKTLVREYFQRLLNEKDLLVCDEMLSGDYVDHDAPPDTPPGPKSIKDFFASFLEEYPNVQIDIQDLIAEGNEIAARIIWRGNRRGSGEEFHQMGIILLRLNDKGQFVERWSAYKSLPGGK